MVRTDFRVEENRCTTGMKVFESRYVVDLGVDYNPLRVPD